MSKYSCCIAVIIVIVVLIICFYSCNQRVRNKADYCIDSDTFAKSTFITEAGDPQQFDYPVIMKPAVKSSCGTGVKLIKSEPDAIAYINNFDFRDDCIIVQEYLDGDCEASIFYIDNHITGNKYIHEIVMKKRKGTNTNFEPAACYTGIFSCDSVQNTSPVLQQQVIADMSNFPDMNVAKLDVIAKSHQHLLDGDYKIIEINSRFGEASSTHSQNMFTYTKYYAEWFGTRVLFGAHNLATGKGLSPKNVFVDAPKYAVLYSRMI